MSASGLAHGHGHEVEHEAHHAHPKPAPALPHNAVKLAGRNLMIQGTNGNDTIKVAVNADDPTKLDVTYNGVTKTLAAGKIKRIFVNAKAGDDSVTIDSSVNLKSMLLGGAGNDSLTGGSGDDVLIDTSGTNQITGGAGADHFFAQSASDVLDLDATQNDVLTLPKTTTTTTPPDDNAGDGAS
jgi:Ca2+-binding RTX toxin-like protein